MRVFQIEKDWGYDNLKVSQRPDPKPAAGQVLLRMKASAINYRDLLVPDRGYGAPTGLLPPIRLGDGAGELVDVGAGVTRVKTGERALPTFCQAWISGPPTPERMSRSLGGPADGTMADYMCLSEQGIVKAPAYLSDLEAASLPCAALTAWSAIVTHESLGPGSKVLVQGTGGVALFAIQIAKMLGAHVTVISSSDEKIARAKQLGLVVTRQVRLQGITVGNRDGFEAMLRAFEQHKIKPVLDRTFAFEELKEAMAYLKTGAHFGKVCIQH